MWGAIFHHAVYGISLQATVGTEVICFGENAVNLHVKFNKHCRQLGECLIPSDIGTMARMDPLK